MSERQYAEHVGLSRGAIQKARKAERLVLFPDGSIDAAASNARRAETTDPSKTRKPGSARPRRQGHADPGRAGAGPDLDRLLTRIMQQGLAGVDQPSDLA
jgi:hypothetical protein